MVLATCVAASSSVLAQSLAALAARSTSDDRAAVKTYTNADLDTVTSSPAAPSPGGLAADAEAPAAAQAAPPTARTILEEGAGEGHVNSVTKVEKNSSAENEPFWRRVTKSVKDRIATAEAQLAMIAKRLETAGDNDREKLTSLQTKGQRDLESLNAEYAGHVKRAQALGVPPEWLR
jgi:hypothetical protein